MNPKSTSNADAKSAITKTENADAKSAITKTENTDVKSNAPKTANAEPPTPQKPLPPDPDPDPDPDLNPDPTVEITVSDNGTGLPWEGGINGRFYRIKRGQKVTVPLSVARLIALNNRVTSTAPKLVEEYAKGNGKCLNSGG